MVESAPVEWSEDKTLFLVPEQFCDTLYVLHCEDLHARSCGPKVSTVDITHCDKDGQAIEFAEKINYEDHRENEEYH